MSDLNELLYFDAVVRHGGFSAAARALGIEKTRLSRRVASLEQRLGVQLLQRSTRRIALTEAGERFHVHCQSVVDGARAAFESVATLQHEPKGSVRMACPVALAQGYLAPLLPAYLAQYPKVQLSLEATDRAINLAEERFDVVLRARPTIEDSTEFVAKELGRARHILVASPSFLDYFGHPLEPGDLGALPAICRLAELHDSRAAWTLMQAGTEPQRAQPSPRLISDDLRVQAEAVAQGIGIALLPEAIVATALAERQVERVLPDWSAHEHILHLVHNRPRGLLPSVRSLVDYLVQHLPASMTDTQGVKPR
jgi:DNA-binding transcriptional LysR family regulator